MCCSLLSAHLCGKELRQSRKFGNAAEASLHAPDSLFSRHRFVASYRSAHPTWSCYRSGVFFVDLQFPETNVFVIRHQRQTRSIKNAWKFHSTKSPHMVWAWRVINFCIFYRRHMAKLLPCISMHNELRFLYVRDSFKGISLIHCWMFCEMPGMFANDKLDSEICVVLSIDVV